MLKCAVCGQPYNEAEIAKLRDQSYASLEAEVHRLEKLLSDWGAIAKGLRLTQFNGEISDYDDELASLLVNTAKATLDWRDRPR